MATVESELDGWVYQQDRDLTGFIDGTENPSAFEAPEIVAPGGDGSGVVDGVRDELTRVTTPLTGGYCYVPSLEQLASYAPVVDPED